MTWDHIARARDPVRHARFQECLLKKCSARRLKSQANPTMKELAAEILIRNRPTKELKDGTGNASRDKRLLQAEKRKTKQGK